MTKAELIEKLKNTRHLANTVHEKDVQLAELRQEVIKLRNGVSKEEHEKIIDNIYAEVQVKLDVANEVIEAYESALHLLNSAMWSINKIDNNLKTKIN